MARGDESVPAQGIPEARGSTFRGKKIDPNIQQQREG